MWAGTTPRGFDCSGFTRFVYAHMGISLPHSSYAQWTMGRHIGRHALRPGDLVFFAGLGHVGLWIGHGRFIHAPQTGLGAGWSPTTEIAQYASASCSWRSTVAHSIGGTSSSRPHMRNGQDRGADMRAP
jgi:cell wall-associated NlpC family hydrolase